jgi:hypothetical protein
MPDELDLDALDLTAVTPERFARIVRDAPPERTAAVMAGPHRRRVLDEVFHRMPSRFRGEAAGDREALVRWRITAPDGEPDTYETAIAGGRLTVTAHRTDRDATLTLTMSGPDLLRLTSGAMSGPMLLITRRLTADGDLLLAAALTRWFDLPTAV